MTLKNFAYWSRWHLDRAGLSDFDVFLYPWTTPLGFFQPGARAIAMSLPHVLLDSWTRVIDKTFKHEIAHALTPDEKEIHGAQWARAARANGSLYKTPGDISDEFCAYADRYRASHWGGIMKIEESALAEQMLQETRERGGAAHVGRLRLDFIDLERKI